MENGPFIIDLLIKNGLFSIAMLVYRRLCWIVFWCTWVGLNVGYAAVYGIVWPCYYDEKHINFFGRRKTHLIPFEMSSLDTWSDQGNQGKWVGWGLIHIFSAFFWLPREATSSLGELDRCSGPKSHQKWWCWGLFINYWLCMAHNHPQILHFHIIINIKYKPLNHIKPWFIINKFTTLFILYPHVWFIMYPRP